ncbi:MAG: calcium/proton exchanger [Thaumarchaeota archaeon]|nr:calcium/proton exchanger [Nitrososphaerota archaeon]
MTFTHLKISRFYYLLVFTPVAIALEFLHADHVLIFVAAGIAILPLAKLIGDSTEHLAVHYGSVTGSLLNVTFGNAAEVIIALIALNAGLFDLIKASIAGSIIGNVLLIFGLSIIAGGLRKKEQLFNSQNAGVQTSMLFLAVIGLAVPTILAETELKGESIANQNLIQLMSDALAFTLLAVYIGSIAFTFITHKHLFVTPEETDHEHHALWSKKRAFLLLAVAMAFVALVAEILVGSVQATSEEFGFGELFVGAIIVGLVGNAAEHSSAILLARKEKMDTAIGIAAGSGTQIALFVVPLLVIAGIVLGKPLTLVFTIYELVAVFLSAIIMNLIAHDGKSNWFEGVMLTAVYVIIGIGFYFIG